MKTILVLCSLATIAIAVPTSLRENLHGFEDSLVNIPDNEPEKKSAEHDSSQGLTINDEKENTQMLHSDKANIESSSLGKTKANFRKPIIIKKKFGYHVYRDSDEEMAHADPYENCKKQFKIKLCDGEPILHTGSNGVKSLLSEKESESNSGKQMKNSLKMAKEAVENLEKGIQLLEYNSAKKSESKESMDSGITLQQDIEMAKSALDHIQRRMGNLEVIGTPVNEKEAEEIKSINQWKEAIDNLHKNVKISENTDDALNVQTQNLQQSDNTITAKMSENEKSDMDLEHSTNLRSSTTKDENEIIENDLFVASTNRKESEVLRSESLTAENNLKLKSSDGHDDTQMTLDSNYHPVITKNSEILSLDSNLKNMKVIDTDVPEEKVAEGAEIETLQRSNEENAQNQMETKDTENSISAKLTKEEYEEEQQHKDHIHSPALKSTEQTLDQNKAEVKMVEISDDLHSDNSQNSLVTETEETNVNSPTKKFIPVTNSLARANLVKNEESDIAKAVNIHNSNINDQSAHLSSLATVESGNDHHLMNELSGLKMNDNHNTNHLLNENIEDQLNDFHQSFMRLAQEKQLNDMLLQQLKNMEQTDNEHKIKLLAKTNEFEPTEQLNNYMVHIHDTVPLGTLENNNFMAMPNDDTLLTPASSLKNVENSHNGHTNMRLVEGINSENMGHNLIETQNFNSHLGTERWAKENHQGPHAMKSMSELNNLDMLLTPTNNNEFYGGHHAHSENLNTNMRTLEGLNLGHLLTDNYEMNGPNSMRWAQDKQHSINLAQTYNTADEYPNIAAHWNNHFHESTPTDAINNFGLDDNQDLYTMRSGMPDHLHLLKHAKPYDMDSTMQPSMHMDMKHSDKKWNHHPHHHHHHHHNQFYHDLSRASYPQSQLNSDANTGAVGVFSNANTGNAIPLLLSCSPSVISGSLARAHPRGIPNPAYRTGENLMHYIKRDANQIGSTKNVTQQKETITLKH